MKLNEPEKILNNNLDKIRPKFFCPKKFQTKLYILRKIDLIIKQLTFYEIKKK